MTKQGLNKSLVIRDSQVKFFMNCNYFMSSISYKNSSNSTKCYIKNEQISQSMAF